VTQGNFAHLPRLLGEVPGGGASAGVNGILMDLGFSSMQVGSLLCSAWQRTLSRTALPLNT